MSVRIIIKPHFATEVERVILQIDWIVPDSQMEITANRLPLLRVFSMQTHWTGHLRPPLVMKLTHHSGLRRYFDISIRFGKRRTDYATT